MCRATPQVAVLLGPITMQVVAPGVMARQWLHNLLTSRLPGRRQCVDNLSSALTYLCPPSQADMHSRSEGSPVAIWPHVFSQAVSHLAALLSAKLQSYHMSGQGSVPSVIQRLSLALS